MNWIDIVLIIPLLWAARVGYRDGVIAQLGGIAGVLLGVWLAFRFSAQVGVWLNLPEAIRSEAAFLIIIVAVVIVVGLLGKLLGRLFDSVGLALVNKFGGVLLALVKMSLMLSVLIMGFELVNNSTKWVDRKTIESAILYEPVQKVSSAVFPYLIKLKNGVNE
ncbi:MAG: CvpA family protein [Rikenellaceae bacterium]|nr:CvpA family protein [Rikenellaceae bacterium]